MSTTPTTPTTTGGSASPARARAGGAAGSPRVRASGATTVRPAAPGAPGPTPARGRRVLAVADAVLGGPLPGRLARWDTPAMTYSVLQGAVLLLLGTGLLMVLSSSSVESLSAHRSPFAVGQAQAVYAAGGLVVMLAASRLPLGLVQRLAPLAVAVALVLQLLVFSPLGLVVSGNRNWLSVGGVSAQPSELGKVALAVWCAAVLARKRAVLDRPGRWVVAIGVGAGPIIAAVLLGHDLGTALVLLLIVAAALFTAGVPLRHLAAPALAGALGVAFLVVTSASRSKRLLDFASGSGPDEKLGWQPTHALWALATGHVTGVGLGASRQKWDWLPEAGSDYIFAILGEELGLLGTLVVLALFCVLGWACLRVVRRSDDLFAQVLVGAVAAWVLGQAAVNVAVVLRLLPVLGLPLPLISQGGSALVCTLAGLGLVLACARAVPGARAGLRSSRGLRRRSRALVPLPRRAR